MVNRLVFVKFQNKEERIYFRGLKTCADPEGGTGGPDPPWNLKILPKKGNFGIFGGLDPPSSVTKNYHFRWTPSHENFWISAWKNMRICIKETRKSNKIPPHPPIIVFRLIKCIIIKDQEIFSTLSVIPGNCQVNSPWSYMVRRNHSEL